MEKFKLTGPSWEETLEAIKDMTPNIVLFNGAKFGSIELVQYALAIGADIHYNNDVALRIACNNNYADIVRFLIDRGAYICNVSCLGQIINVLYYTK